MKTSRKELQQIIKHNESFTHEMIEKYNNLVGTFKEKKIVPTADFEFWVDIQETSLRNEISDLGKYINGFIKHIKITKTKEILQLLELDIDLCINSSKAEEFYAIQKVFENETGKEFKSNFVELFESYMANTMDEIAYKKLYYIIDCLEQSFKKKRLKLFSVYLLGVTYDDLVSIKRKCFDEAYAKHIKVNMEFKKIDIISKLEK